MTQTNTLGNLELRELFADDVAGNAKLQALLINEEKIHALGKAVGRTPNEDLLQRLAQNEGAAKTSRKRGFALYVSGEELPRFVVYCYMNAAKKTQVESREGHPQGPSELIAAADYPASMAAILNPNNDENTTVAHPNIAVCYTISALYPSPLNPADDTKPRVRASELLGRVYDKMKQEGIVDIVTLSPMSEFDQWLEEEAVKVSSQLFDPLDIKLLRRLAPDAPSPVEAFRLLYQDENYNQLTGNDLAQFNALLEQVGFSYLMEANQPNNKQPYDVVQCFHMGNGAIIAKVTAQRQQDDDVILVTHPGERKDGSVIERSLNKLNVSYKYVPERHRHLNQDKLREGERLTDPD